VKQKPNEKYLQFVSATTPTTKERRTLLHAFFIGGTICSVGQFLRYMLSYWAGLSGDTLAGTVSVILIFLGSLLTGLGVYDRIGKFSGGGSIVPITGFANSMVSAAMEFRREGMVLGMGAKLFSVAGPVLVYGISSSAVVGILYAIFRWR